MFGAISSKDLETINSYFKNFVDFIQYQQSQFQYIETTGNSKVDAMFKEWNQLIRETDVNIKNDMKVLGEIVLTLDKVEQGIYKCRIRATTLNPMINTLQNTINKMLDTVGADMEALRDTLVHYADDDYRTQVSIHPKIRETMLEVLSSVNKLGDTLSSAARTNLNNGQALEDNAHSMTNSMNNLSKKANEQAASLEETAAALEEITSITRANAENASKMATLGQTVKGSVSNGQKLASKTATSMDEINERVNAITESIEVIDQIAFQTNILSLNAAVEAATAGEAGKGFAVVAGEVRNLASRSADAAKNIKDLVEDANQKANDGKKISDSMIKGYEELNTHISETIHIIEDVSSASKEQMSGIEQINDAITLLDRTTQENASESNSVLNIAYDVLDISNQLVDDAKNKKFD